MDCGTNGLESFFHTEGRAVMECLFHVTRSESDVDHFWHGWICWTLGAHSILVIFVTGMQICIISKTFVPQ